MFVYAVKIEDVPVSRKFWSAKNFDPGDQYSWKIGPPMS